MLAEHGSGVSMPMMLGFLPIPFNGDPDQSQLLQASSALVVPGAAPILEAISVTLLIDSKQKGVFLLTNRSSHGPLN